MTMQDDDHRVAKIIKDLEQRIADLEETSRQREAPNPLVTLFDTSGFGDRVDRVDASTIDTGAWDSTGWDTSAWGNYGF